MLGYIYIIIIILVTLCIMYLYSLQVSDYNAEMNKIKIIEQKNEQRQKLLSQVRSLSIPSPISNLTDPRSCYKNSNSQCSWNEIAERCDKK